MYAGSPRPINLVRAQPTGSKTANMPLLISPTIRVHASFLAAMSEFMAEGRGGPDDDTMVGDELSRYGPRWADRPFSRNTSAGCARRLRKNHPAPQASCHAPPCGGSAKTSTWPASRSATAMLAAALPVASALGIDPVLITCDEDNIGSRKVIEAAGGTLEDQRGIKLRFWVPAS
jgi:hypothetical protein